MFNLRGIAGDSPFSIQQEAELMIGHVISHGCLNGTFRRIGITRFHHFNGERNGCCTRRDINIRTLFVILHHIARFVEKGHSDAGCRLISCLVLKIIAVRGIGNTAKSDAGDTVATFFRGRAIS